MTVSKVRKQLSKHIISEIKKECFIAIGVKIKEAGVSTKVITGVVARFMSLMTIARGTSIIPESIF